MRPSKEITTPPRTTQPDLITFMKGWINVGEVLSGEQILEMMRIKRKSDPKRLLAICVIFWSFWGLSWEHDVQRWGTSLFHDGNYALFDICVSNHFYHQRKVIRNISVIDHPCYHSWTLEFQKSVVLFSDNVKTSMHIICLLNQGIRFHSKRGWGRNGILL